MTANQRGLATKESGVAGKAYTDFKLHMSQATGMTGWFGDDTKPARPGLYQVKAAHASGASVEWCWWSGIRWGWAYAHKRAALSREWCEAEGATQAKVWRGITAQAYFA